MPGKWFQKQARYRRRRVQKRSVKHHHQYGGGFAAAHRAKAAAHRLSGDGQGFAAYGSNGGSASGAKAESRPASSDADRSDTCSSGEGRSCVGRALGYCYHWVCVLVAIVLSVIAVLWTCGAAVGVYTQHAFHYSCMRLGLAQSRCIRLSCRLNGHTTAALLDSGASHCFVDAKWAQMYMGKPPVVLSSPVSFKTASGRMTCGEVYPNVKIKLGSFKAVVSCIPVDLGWSLGNNTCVAFLLGNDFLCRYNPSIDWQQQVVQVKGVVLPLADRSGPPGPGSKSDDPTVGDSDDAEFSNMMISKLQAKRLMRKGCPAFVCTATQVEAEPETTHGVESLAESICHPSVKSMLRKFASVFDEPMQLPPDRPDCDVVHGIDLQPGARPSARTAYKQSYEELGALKEILKEFSEKGWIRKSSSAFAAPILLIRKPDNTYRFTCDYRGLNGLTVKQSYPLPTCDTIFEQLAGAKYFSKMDAFKGFHQLRMRAGDEYKTAFTTRYGLWEWLVMPMGLQGAPSTFQRAMNTLFHDLLDAGVMVYLDGLLIYAATREEHDRLLHELLSWLDSNLFKISLAKCVFGQQELSFLGHVLTPEGLKPSAAKIKSITEWPVPQTASELRSFVFLCSYYRKFVYRFADIASPMHEVLRGNAKGKLGDKWTPECQLSFEQLKQALVSSPVLRYVQPGQPMYLGCDASDFAISGVLSQMFEGVLHPVGYFSRKLSDVESRYAARDRELLAIVSSVKFWHHLVEGVPLHVKSDHESLSTFLSPGTKLISQQHKRWLALLEGLNITIEHIAGKDNVVPDLVSRRPDYHVHAVDLVQTGLLDQVKAAGALDLGYYKLGKQKGMKLVDGVVYQNSGKSQRVVVPNDAQLRELIMFEAHMASGHCGSAKTLARLVHKFWWKGVAAEVREFCRGCQICQEAKRSTVKAPGLLHSLPVPEGKFEYVSIDQVFGMPVVQGFDGFFTVTDLLTKYVLVIPCASTDDAVKSAQLLDQGVFKRFGLPRGIISDRDPKYTSAFWGALFAALGTKLHMTTAFRPQSDGQSERTNQSVEQMLRCKCMHDQERWLEFVPDVCQAYNGNVHASTGFSPAELLFGYQPRTVLDLAVTSDTGLTNQSAADMLESMRKNLAEAREQLQQAKKWQADSYNKRHVALSLAVGDQVMLSSKHIELKASLSSKLKVKWLGPYKVVKVVSPVSYQLELPRGLHRLHPVFHVSKLKRHVKGSPLLAAPAAEPVLVDGEEEYEVQSIAKHKQVRGVMQYLVVWKNAPLHEAQWKSELDLPHCRALVSAYKRRHGL